MTRQRNISKCLDLWKNIYKPLKDLTLEYLDLDLEKNIYKPLKDLTLELEKSESVKKIIALILFSIFSIFIILFTSMFV